MHACTKQDELHVSKKGTYVDSKIGTLVYSMYIA